MTTSPETLSADYHRVERAIRYIEDNRLDQPTLEDVAGAMGLSPFHAQRVFTRWAGVSPKRFLGQLTVEHAKTLLRQSASVLDATYDVGLSGPSRLHDLFVTYEALTPGEYKAQGQGMLMRWGVHPTPFGDALFVVNERGLTRVAFLAEDEKAEPLIAKCRDWPLSGFVHDPEATAPWAERCFPEGTRHEPVQLLLKGTPFQIQVWRALMAIPEGATATYGEIAAAIGRPGAVRAVGTACGANPIAWLIPCHRVIRDTGALGGYRWGPLRKQAMLAWERSRADARAA